MTIYDYRLAKIPFANAAPSNEIQPFPNYNLGLGIAFIQTDGKPEMKGLNGLFQAITVSLLYLRQRGVSEWITEFEYPKNALVSHGDLLYKAKNANTSKQPNLSQNDWIIWASISDIKVDANGNITKTTAADGSATLKVEDATTSTKGVSRFATPSEVANQSQLNIFLKPSDIANMFATGGGSTVLPNGLIVQFGQYSINGNTTIDINLNIKFKVSGFIFANFMTPAAGTINAEIVSLSKVRFESRGNSSQQRFQWLAIGY